ncbi:MAG: hypothetical protein J6A54_04165 [Clostridia bacterium]|nr:hypothetical protein [Clostridia bacterium]
MLENEKKKYKVYRINAQRVCKEEGECSLAVYMTSDRRDEDEDGLCVYLKRTYYGICNIMDIRTADIIKIDGRDARVLTVSRDGNELILHLESIEVLDTGAYDYEGDE